MKKKNSLEDTGHNSLQTRDHNLTLVIEPKKRFTIIDYAALSEYRDLFWFLIWRQVKVRYAQTLLGFGWAIIQPLFSMLVFTIIFGNLAKIESDGTPYALFSLAALLPWTYFSNAVTDGVNSLVSEANMLRKIYFPRILLPLASVAAKLVDFSIAFAIMILMMIWFKQMPTTQVIYLPYLVLLMVCTASAISTWLAALSVQYRDVKHALTFLIQLGMYATPIVYPTSLVPLQYQWLYAINPMAGIVEGFRAGLLGTQQFPFQMVIIGTFSALALLISGLIFFHSKESTFADIS